MGVLCPVVTATVVSQSLWTACSFSTDDLVCISRKCSSMTSQAVVCSINWIDRCNVPVRSWFVCCSCSCCRRWYVFYKCNSDRERGNVEWRIGHQQTSWSQSPQRSRLTGLSIHTIECSNAICLFAHRACVTSFVVGDGSASINARCYIHVFWFWSKMISSENTS